MANAAAIALMACPIQQFRREPEHDGEVVEASHDVDNIVCM